MSFLDRPRCARAAAAFHLRRLCRRGGLAAAALLCSAAVTAAPTLGAHVHGAAELRVVVDGNQLELGLESPLDNLLGFEAAPRTEAQRAAVRTMAAKLRQAQTLFVPTASAQCTLASVQLSSSALPAELLGETKPAAESRPAESGHADLDATFTFQCAAPAQLKGLEVRLMQAFPGLRKLDVQVAGPRGQSGTTLTPAKRTISW